MNCLNELFETAADKIYCERVERIYESNWPEKMTDWEFNFIYDLYWNPQERYTDKQKAVINRILRKLNLD